MLITTPFIGIASLSAVLYKTPDLVATIRNHIAAMFVHNQFNNI